MKTGRATTPRTTLQSLLSNIPDTHPSSTHDIDTLTDTITHHIITAATLSFPAIIPKSSKHPTSAPAYASKLTKGSHTLRKLIASTSHTSPLHRTYKTLLNHTTKSIRKAKLEKKHRINSAKISQLQNLKQHQPREFWKSIKSITQITTKSKIKPLIISPDGTTTIDPKLQADTHASHLRQIMTPLPIITPSLDTHHSHSPNIDLSHRNIPANTHKEVDDWFHHVFTQQSQTIPQTHPDNIQSFTNNPPSLSDSLSQTADPVSATDVELSINSRLLHASHSSPGHDHITYQLLKHAPQQLTTLLTKLYNSSLFLGYLPSSAKTSHITVIPKPHLDHKLPKNFRPLSLTPSIWKVLEGILHSRIMHHMEHNHLINNSQFGFRHDHSTTDAVLTMLHKILNNKASNRHSLGFFADISKAFDKVCIKSLMYKITYTISLSSLHVGFIIFSLTEPHSSNTSVYFQIHSTPWQVFLKALFLLLFFSLFMLMISLSHPLFIPHSLQTTHPQFPPNSEVTQQQNTCKHS